MTTVFKILLGVALFAALVFATLPLVLAAVQCAS